MPARWAVPGRLTNGAAAVLAVVLECGAAQCPAAQKPTFPAQIREFREENEVKRWFSRESWPPNWGASGHSSLRHLEKLLVAVPSFLGSRDIIL